VAILDSEITVAQGVILHAGTLLSIETALTKTQVKQSVRDALPDLPLYCSPVHIETNTVSATLGDSLWSKFICLQDSKGNRRLDRLVLKGYKKPERFRTAEYEIIWASHLEEWRTKHR
jgi:hypothetical protein